MPYLGRNISLMCSLGVAIGPAVLGWVFLVCFRLWLGLSSPRLRRVLSAGLGWVLMDCARRGWAFLHLGFGGSFSSGPGRRWAAFAVSGPVVE